MNEEQIKVKLINCANTLCQGCDFKDAPPMYCKQLLIRKLADELNRIDEERERNERVPNQET